MVMAARTFLLSVKKETDRWGKMIAARPATEKASMRARISLC
jgi:hypothetical protein